MVYGEFKYLAKRTASDEVLKDKAFNIAKIAKYDGYQRCLASMVYKFFDRKSASGSGVKHLQINLLLIMKLNKMSVIWTWLRTNWLTNYTNQLLNFF